MNILFTCAGRRNYLVNYFKEVVGKNDKIFAADMQLNAPALVDAHEAVIVPSIYDSKYIDTLLSICKKHAIDAVIPLNDLELPVLAENRERFSEVNTKVIVSNTEVVDIAFDKWKTVDFLRKNHLKTPKTYLSLSEAKKATSNGELSYPLVVKPRWGSASIAVNFVYNNKELEYAYQLQLSMIKRSILSTASNEDKDRAILIQEKIKGIEYGMDILNDFKQNYYHSFAREKLSMRSGETDKAISVMDDELENIGKTIGENLKHIGNLDCDVFYDGTDYYVLEFNPRFGGGYPFSHEAGINTPAIYVSWLKGNDDIDKYNNYKAGISFAKYDKLLNILGQEYKQ